MKFPRAEAFDILGLATFGVMTLLGVRAVFFQVALPLWTPWFFLVVGILGLLIDGAIVYRTYYKKTGDELAPVVK